MTALLMRRSIVLAVLLAALLHSVDGGRCLWPPSGQEPLPGTVKAIDLSNCDQFPPWVANIRGLEMIKLNGATFGYPEDTFHSGNFPDLISLDISDMQLTELPLGATSFPRLKHLIATNNGLTVVPDHLGRLASLETLDLSGNLISSIDSHAFDRLSRLEELTLKKNLLTQLPQAPFASLTALRKLDISTNRLTSIPASLPLMPALRVVLASYNMIASLPSTIGSFPQMQDKTSRDLVSYGSLANDPKASRFLDFYHNRLTELPDELGSLVGLTALSVGHNPLSHLPASLGRLSSLVRLEASHTLLTQLPSDLSGLSNLAVLIVQGSGLTELPASLCGLEYLRELMLSRNALTGLPSCLASCPVLKDLILTNNSLTEFPSFALALPSLRTLNLGTNKIASVPPELATKATIRDIDLSRNPLKELPQSFAEAWPLARTLNFRKCPGLRVPYKMALRDIVALSGDSVLVDSDGAIVPRSTLFPPEGYMVAPKKEPSALDLPESTRNPFLEDLERERKAEHALPPLGRTLHDGGYHDSVAAGAGAGEEKLPPVHSSRKTHIHDEL